MTRLMYDAFVPAHLPAGGMFAAYVDGRDTHDNYRAVRARFPHALIVKITVTGLTLDAQVADIETGDLTPAHGAAWAARKIRAHRHPTLYCNASTWPAVLASVARLGIPPTAVSYWIADYDEIPVIPPRAIGKQFSTGRFDTSIVTRRWPGVDY